MKASLDKQINDLVEAFWAVTPSSVAVGYRHFGRPCCLHFQPDEDSMDLRNVGILHNPEDLALNLYHRENIKSRIRNMRYISRLRSLLSGGSLGGGILWCIRFNRRAVHIGV